MKNKVLCKYCGSNSNRFKFLNNKWYCHKCLNLSEAGDRKFDSNLTRMRLRQDSWRFEGDTLPPTYYDKNSKRLKLSPEFLKKYPDKVKNFFNENEVSKEYPKLANYIKNQKKEEKELKNQLIKDIHFSGDFKKKIKKILK